MQLLRCPTADDFVPSPHCCHVHDTPNDGENNTGLRGIHFQVLFPLTEYVLFYYVLQWRSRFLLAWLTLSLRILTMRL